MITVPFTHNLRSKRKKASLNQKQAAEAIGMTRKRWNNIELGKRRPNSSELSKMQNLLGPIRGSIRPSKINKELIAEGLRAIEIPAPYYTEQDRPAFTRYYAASQRCPDLVDALTAVVTARKDFAQCDYLCDQIAFGSYAEVLKALHLLARGARPALVAPSWIQAALPRPLIDPRTREHVGHRLSPCLIFEQGFYFFQMSFETPRTFTVDVLCWRNGWTVIEIDGDGHNFANDSEREAAIGLPFVRYRASELERLDFKPG